MRKSTFTVAHSDNVSPLFTHDGVVKKAAPFRINNKGYQEPYEPFDWSICEYKGINFGIEKMFEGVKPNDNMLVTPDYVMRAAKRNYAKTRRWKGGIWIGIGCLALAVVIVFAVSQLI